MDQENTVVTEDKNRNLFFTGVGLSIVYLLLISAYLLCHENSLLDLNLNEFGDFLAGTFGPLAILWLILGFMQQSKELALQAEELKNLVKQNLAQTLEMKVQNETASQALEFERLRRRDESLPKFVFYKYRHRNSAGNYDYGVNLKNIGGGIHDLVIESMSALEILPEKANYLNDNEIELRVIWRTKNAPTWPDSPQMKIEFLDSQNIRQTALFSISKLDSGDIHFDLVKAT